MKNSHDAPPSAGAEQLLEPIAIIGIACRFPGGANSPEELWRILADGKSAWTEIPADRYTWKSFHHPHPEAEAGHNQRGGGYIDRDLAAFDAAFFGISTTEANGLDPQQRIQLETAYEALENAGLSLDGVRGSKTSVHVATVSRDYDRNAYRDPQDLAKYHLTGCGEAIASGRVSYTFDLRGPCFSLDTGCSGSLVGVHLAAQGLRSCETDMAIVGGTNLLLSPDMTMAMSKLHMLNDDGKCYAFDSRGKGYARSEGVSAVVLKRLSDAIEAGDPIRAIIRNTGMNQDGKTNGIMFPNSQAQIDLMRSIHLDAGLDPGLTAYIEAHGTGTQAGDKAEIDSISKVFCDGIERSQPLFVGSIKANIGHCESASGLAGLIKTVLALEKGLIPATPNVIIVKEDLNLQEHNIRIPQKLETWPPLSVRRAAINSFGYGGTNVAAVLESYYHQQEGTKQLNNHKDIRVNEKTNGICDIKTLKAHSAILFVLSAKSPKALMGNLQNLRQWVGDQLDVSQKKLLQLAFTLSEKRSKFSIRSNFMAGTREEFLAATLSAIERRPEKASTQPKLSFVFTGQGAQWYAMGRELIGTHSSFRTSLKESEKILSDFGASWKLLEELDTSQDASRINESEISQPATTALQIALVDLLDTFSIRPDSTVGHSSGEIAAAYAAGALTKKSALQASFYRGRISQLARQVVGVPGGMLVTSLGETAARSYIDRVAKGRLSLACINSPDSTTISGDMDAIEELKGALETDYIMAKILPVDVAYHSQHMMAVAEHYLSCLRDFQASTSRDNVQFFSSVTGRAKTSGFGAEYWVQNLVSTVRFSDALLALHGESLTCVNSRAACRVFVEIGPHSALAGPSKRTLASSKDTPISYKYASALVRGKNAYTTILALAGNLFEFGLDVNIETVNAMANGTRGCQMIVDLPPYAWDYSNRYWHESRLSKDYRFRKHPYHDLLGLRLIGSTPLEPIWRNILSIDTQPWLREHVIDGCPILPGSSFIVMAIEAACQLNEERGGPRVKRFLLKKVNYYKAIMIPDSPGKVEVMIGFSAPASGAAGQSHSSAWENFQITSSNDASSWALNCRGSMRLEFDTEENEVDRGLGERQEMLNMRHRLSQAKLTCTQPIDHKSLYEEMRHNGIDYGTNFATIQKLQIGPWQGLGQVIIPDVAQCMPSRYQQPHTIHPVTFDALMHIVMPLYFRHCSVGTAMLISIDELSVAADMATAPGSGLDVHATLSASGLRNGQVDVCAFQNGDNGADPVVVLRGQKFQGIAKSSTPTIAAKFTSSPFHTLRRPLKMTIATPGVVGSLCFVDDEEAAHTHLRPHEVEIKGFAYALDEVDVDIMLGRSENFSIIGECAGIITALGSDWKHSFQIGDKACCWNTNVAFASQNRVKGSFVQKMPDSWPMEMGAALPKNMSIAYYGLHDCARVEKGQTVLVHAATGPVGQAVVLVANLLGLQVVATVKSRAQKQALESFRGTRASQILYSDDGASLSRMVLHLTNGAGVSAVLNTSSTALPEELMACVMPFGTVVDMNACGGTPVLSDRAVKHISFDAAQLLRHRPSSASAAFEAVAALLWREDPTDLLAITVKPLADGVSAFKAVKGPTYMGKMVLLANEDAMVNVKEIPTSISALADIERIAEIITGLSITQEQKNNLHTLLSHLSAGGSNDAGSSSANGSDEMTSSASRNPMSAEQRLAAASSMFEAREIILEEQTKKVASLVTIDIDHLDSREPLADLGLDSLITIELKDWLKRTFGADVGSLDILDAPGLAALAALVARKSTFIPAKLPEQRGNESPQAKGIRSNAANGTAPLNRVTSINGTASLNDTVATNLHGATNVVSNDTKVGLTAAVTRPNRFVANKLPKLPFLGIDALCDAFLESAKAYATPIEMASTIRSVEEFKRPGSAGRTLYDRGAARANDPSRESWDSDLQAQVGFLNLRCSLSPCVNFWFGHPHSKQQHSQAERAALIAYTAHNYKLKLEAGLAKPVVLNEQELTTAFHPWIFNAVRIPAVNTDEMQKFPSYDYCIVFWKGHPFKLNLSTEDRSATFDELFAAFQQILNQSVARSFIPIFTSDARHPWAGMRKKLQLLDSQNAASVAIIEAAAFTVSLDEAAPLTSAERARQFHFGGQNDAANRWHDKSLQFVICANGFSATIGEHSMMDALTLSELNEAIAAAICSHSSVYVDKGGVDLAMNIAITPEPLSLRVDAQLRAHIEKVRDRYFNGIKDAEHAYLHFEGFAAKALRAQKFAPNSVFQMILLLAGRITFGYSPPCWETVNQAHYHLGRVDIIQVITPQVAAFLAAAQDSAVDLSKRRVLLVEATRSHIALINNAAKNFGWERAMKALRTLRERDEEEPALFEDPIFKRIEPELMASNCFATGMLEKGCIWSHPKAVWSHYEVYDDSAFFTAVTMSQGRATLFCDHLKEAAEVIRQIIFT